MNLVAISLLGFVLAADPEERPAPVAPDARRMVERSLPFLEKGAVEWVETRKCVTCHHVPMLMWTHSEARQHGFAVNEKVVEKLEGEALAQYLGHADFTPTGQDTSFMEKGLGPGTIYLSLAMEAYAAPSEAAAKARARFTENFVKRQNEDGSWTTKINQPPVIDDHDSMTMLILLAMDDSGPNGKNGDSWVRAVKWLKETPARDETETLALRLLVAGKCGDKEERERYVALLRGRQQKDGGWNQKNDLATDAVATGQALYALGASGISADDPDVRQAWGYLASTQQDDGSWQLHSRNPNAKGFVISYFGTGWATLGLIKTLPKPVVAGQ